jgi:hypothetical protein
LVTLSVACLAQNVTVPVAFTPNWLAEPEPLEDGDDPDDEHAAAESSKTAAAAVSVFLGESFIAVGPFSFRERLGDDDLGGDEEEILFP